MALKEVREINGQRVFRKSSRFVGDKNIPGKFSLHLTPNKEINYDVIQAKDRFRVRCNINNVYNEVSSTHVVDLMNNGKINHHYKLFKSGKVFDEGSKSFGDIKEVKLSNTGKMDYLNYLVVTHVSKLVKKGKKKNWDI